jgi:8-oxo-dGTP pyrophosphatase MutT (NUDIX family)
MNQRLPELLAARLARALPGPMAGSRFEPQPPRAQHYGCSPPDARPAAVLILLYPAGGLWHVPLMLRPPGAEPHAGQVSLPGGAVEPGEASHDAALREFHEELGPCAAPIELLGHLSPIYVSVSNYAITPWVAATAERPALVPNPLEVHEVLEVPLAHLLNPDNFGSHQRHREGRPCTAPHFLWDKHRIWGATCMILGELVTLIEELGTGGD